MHRRGATHPGRALGAHAGRAAPAAARELFTERGFAGTGREDIAERAGVTRGALYHHFASKSEVAEAVAEELEADLVDRVIAPPRPAGRRGRPVQPGALAYMEACTEPVDRPNPVSPRRRRCSGWSAAGRSAPADASAPGHRPHPRQGRGQRRPRRPDDRGGLLLGMLNEAAALVAAAPEPEEMRARVASTVDTFLGRLLGPVPPEAPIAD